MRPNGGGGPELLFLRPRETPHAPPTGRLDAQGFVRTAYDMVVHGIQARGESHPHRHPKLVRSTNAQFRPASRRRFAFGSYPPDVGADSSRWGNPPSSSRLRGRLHFRCFDAIFATTDCV